MRKKARKILLVAGVAALVFTEEACYNEGPVGLDDLPTQLGEQEEALPAVVASAENARTDLAVDPLGEPFRMRLALDLDFAGDLEPHQTVTLTMEGTATEKLSGGEVRLLLPTFAAMAEAGSGKPPHYPVGKALPVEARWDLPILDAGAQWKQSVSIDLPDKGYYQVIVEVSAATIDDKSPFVLDDVEHERWLLVADGGGIVTRRLDADRLPDGVSPSEGPFRVRPLTTSAAADGLGGMSMDADNDKVELDASFYDNGYRWNAVGAELWLTYYDEDDEENYSLKRTVPSSGLVVVPCPESDEYLVAGAMVNDTRYTSGNYTLGSTLVWHSDCGETVGVPIDGYTYRGWKNLNDVIPEIMDHFVQLRTAVSWYLVEADTGTFYWPNSDKISLAWDYAKNKWVAAHEYGHAYHHRALGGIDSSVPGECSNHDREKGSSYKCAYAEGFANYAASVGVGSTEWEAGGYSDSPYDPAEIEGNVAALLHDLIDSNNEGNDKTTYPPYYVGRVFESCRADGDSVDDVTDFVWCLENRVNEDEHDAAFPRGPDAPSTVVEYTNEPSNWDADDIRKTWKKNVG